MPTYVFYDIPLLYYLKMDIVRIGEKLLSLDLTRGMIQ